MNEFRRPEAVTTVERPSDGDIAPKPGTFFSDRKRELETARFVVVRNLVYLTYKKKDGSPLMTYIETMDDRDGVRECILAYELYNQLIIPDYERPAMPVTKGELALVNARVLAIEGKVQNTTEKVEALVAFLAYDKERQRKERLAKRGKKL